MHIAFEGMRRLVGLDGCDEMTAVIRSLLRGWGTYAVPSDGQTPPAISLSKTIEGYSRESNWLDGPVVHSNTVNAACDFLVDAFKCYVADNPSLLCLHAAAVDFGDGLYLFPSTYNAGKSTLTAHLASLGVKIFSDDVLYVTENNLGLAPGILPRLRLPLPNDVPETFMDFVNHRIGPQSDRFMYLNLKEEELAAYGEKKTLKGIIELLRESRSELEMRPAGTGDILKRTILQNFSQNVSAQDTLDRLQGLCEKADCYTLRYPNSATAARLLVEKFC